MDLEIYCDESRQDYFYSRDQSDNLFVLIGGLWIGAEKRQYYKDRIKGLRATHNVWGEFKWNRVSTSRIQFYLDLVNLYFEESIRFRCLLLPVQQLHAIHFHEADNELMFYKFYYQLLHHWLIDFNRYRIFLDLKTNRLQNRIRTLEKVLRNAHPASEILSVQALPSNQVDLLQLADLMIGAVGYKFHGCTTSEAKLMVIERIEQNLGHRITPTSREVKKFNIFKFMPSRRW